MATKTSPLTQAISRHLETLSDSDKSAIEQMMASREGADYQDAFAHSMAVLAFSYPPYHGGAPGKHKRGSKPKPKPKKSA